MRDLLDNYMIRAEEERKNKVPERCISLIETKDAEKCKATDMYLS